MAELDKAFLRVRLLSAGPSRTLAGAGGEVIPLTSKAFDTLLLLVENSGLALEKRDPNFDPIRKDPTFVQFMAELKTRWEAYQRKFP